jgi:hypothetical protein
MPYDTLNNEQLVAMSVEVTLKLDALNGIRLAGGAPVSHRLAQAADADRGVDQKYLDAIRRGLELDSLHVELSAEVVARGLHDELVKALQEARDTGVPDPCDQP